MTKLSRTNLKVWGASRVAEGEWKESKRNKESRIGSGWLGLWVSGFLNLFRGDGVDPGGLCTPGLALRDF
ncbi:hypothetical protein I305_04586 [Cryptococcus gattii E566]|uniref:Uncharacterized protein n=2 Tax=Cryptococcus gattii TaxID=37769 RepID=E6RFG4_CRYGW|nr:Hypothetical Protein CGB_M3110W [Cryptococcus gattii WM276]ADV25565.1 Hypothetical Protein CGB_M3110W [Cryptococcus gattii WM276]KIR78827.1 hypothetical protein I306_04189 [Cryptococcus gattii EJB2]KIY32833.1 hypothetical protein I305_04586 [Cryptococcus gattii E566]KJE05103.1 hypothetical protein I311_01196 [Cryptococcus gattii NT-10]